MPNTIASPNFLSRQRRISRKRFRLYRFLKNPLIQHLLYGFGLWVLVFFVFAFNLPPYEFGFWVPLYELTYVSFAYTVLMGIPAFLVFNLTYKGKILKFFDAHIFSDRIVNGWGFPLFLVCTMLVIALFITPLTDIVVLITAPYFENQETPLINSGAFNYMVMAFFIVMSAGSAYTREVIELKRDYRRILRLEEIREKKHKEVIAVVPESPQNTKLSGFMVIKPEKENSLVKVKLKDIVCCEANNVSVKIHLKDGQHYSTRNSLSNIYAQLPEGHFIRVHDSFVVSKRCIVGFSRTCAQLHVKYEVESNGGIKTREIPIGPKHRVRFREWLDSQNYIFLSDI